MIQPSIEAVRERLQGENIAPVYLAFSSDTITPVSAYLSLTDGARKKGFLLESVEKGDQIGRYTFVGTEPSGELILDGDRLVTRGTLDVSVQTDPFEALDEIIRRWDCSGLDELPRFTGGVVGYLGYELIRFIEPSVPVHPPDERTPFPDCHLYLVEQMLIFDHVERRAYLVGHVYGDRDTPVEDQYEVVRDNLRHWKQRLEKRPRAPELRQPEVAFEERLRSNFEPSEFHRAVEEIQEAIQAGETFQVVISQRFELEDPNHPFNLYRRLRSLNPSPYMFYLDFDRFQLVGSSPEVLTQKEGDVVRTRPIAGTRPRGNTPEEDRRLADELQADVKEQAEHTMLVDLGRNDLGRVCEPGSIEVTEQAFIERYSHVMHMVSSAEGTIAEDKNAVDLLRATFPAGTVTGAPKVRAMQIIHGCEPDRRGPYAGAVGYISFCQDLDTCIVIRTMVTARGRVLIQAGAGIVADSRPEREYEETREKARALLQAVETLPTTEFL